MSKQASKRPIERAKRRALFRRVRERKERDRLITSRHGAQAHQSCGRKTRYQTMEAAELVAMRFSTKEAIDMRAYHCDICGGWHITHTKKLGRRKDAD